MLRESMSSPRRSDLVGPISACDGAARHVVGWLKRQARVTLWKVEGRRARSPLWMRRLGQHTSQRHRGREGVERAAVGLRIVAIAAQGTGSYDHQRLLSLLQGIPYVDMTMDRGQRGRLATALCAVARVGRIGADAIFIEGTGLSGGLTALASRVLFGTPYIVSTGDAVGPWVRLHSVLLWPFFAAYERLLFRVSAGVVGWTPYLVGRAITFGAPGGVSVPGWAPSSIRQVERESARREIRSQVDIPGDAIVVGIVGSLSWNHRARYCYGREIVEALSRTGNQRIYGLIVGDGSGLAELRHLVASLGLEGRIRLVGNVPRVEVPRYLAAMDIGSLPQTLDRVGMHRYTTKLAEYADASLPVVTSRNPASYDLDSGWIWRVAGRSPWSETYISSLARLLDSLTRSQVEARRKAAAAAACSTFDGEMQRTRCHCFIYDAIQQRCERRRRRVTMQLP